MLLPERLGGIETQIDDRSRFSACRHRNFAPPEYFKSPTNHDTLATISSTTEIDGISKRPSRDPMKYDGP